MIKKKLMSFALSCIVFISACNMNFIPAQAVVRDNVGNMDTSVPQEAPTEKGGTSANEILEGYGAWVNGELIPGKMKNYSGDAEKTYEITGNTITNGIISKNIDTGYHDGSTVKIAAINSITYKKDEASDAALIDGDDKNAYITLKTGNDNTYAVNGTTITVPIETLKKEVTSLNSRITYLKIVNKGSAASYTYYTIEAYDSDKKIVSSISCTGNNAHWYIDINDGNTISSDSGWNSRE